VRRGDIPIVWLAKGTCPDDWLVGGRYQIVSGFSLTCENRLKLKCLKVLLFSDYEGENPVGCVFNRVIRIGDRGFSKGFYPVRGRLLRCIV